ncbi:MAG: hypothetical protein ACRC57_09360 [Sarcina sp.]
MDRYKVKKGYLLIELTVYLSLVSILLILTLNIGIFIMKNLNYSKKEVKEMMEFMQIHDRVEKLIEDDETIVSMSNIYKNGIDLIRVEDQAKGMIYHDKGEIHIAKFTTNGNMNSRVTLGELKELNINFMQDSNVFYMEYVFENGLKKGVIYEK